MCYLLGGGC